MIENVYTLKIANKSQADHRFSIQVTGVEGITMSGDSEVMIRSGELLDHPISLQADPRYLERSNYDVMFRVQALDDKDILVEEENRFIGPSKR